MNDPRLVAVMLSQLPRLGERTAGRVLQLNAARNIALEEFFRLPGDVLLEGYRLPRLAVQRICEQEQEREREAIELLQQMRAGGVDVWLAGDAAYPKRWRVRLDPAPPIVFALGCSGLSAGPTIAVLNSRALDERGVTAIIRIVQAAAEQGLTVVSGGMKASHRIAAVMARSAPARVVVLDRGLFAAFGRHLDRDPFGFGPGRAALDAARTLVLSSFRLRDPAVARNGSRRDQLVAALADIVVAVNARPGGQIERICFEALDRGQCVLSWLGENAGLVAAGAVAIDGEQISALRGFLAGD